MLNREIAEVTAMLVSGALQSGQLPTGAEQVAEYYAKLYGLLAEYFSATRKPQVGGPHQEVRRLTEEPDEFC